MRAAAAQHACSGRPVSPVTCHRPRAAGPRSARRARPSSGPQAVAGRARACRSRRLLGLAASLALPLRGGLRDGGAPRTTAGASTPSSSATTMSPGWTIWPAEDHGDVHRTGARLHRALRAARPATRPGNPSRAALQVADPGVDDQPRHTARGERGREQLAEHAVGRRRGRGHHQHVAGAAQLHRRVDHQVVAGVAGDRDGRAGDRASRPASAGWRGRAARSAPPPRAPWRLPPCAARR